jgi:hypothetical protein
MRIIIVGLTLLTSGAVVAANNIQPLNVKTGLWETNAITTISGQPPIPAEDLAKLTPEQRAKMETAMKSLAGTRNLTYKSCVTKEKLAKGTAFDKSSCTWTTFTSTSTKAEMTGVCTEERYMKVNVNLHIMVLNPESITGSGQMSFSGNGRTMSSSSTMTAKWLGPDCGTVK